MWRGVYSELYSSVLDDKYKLLVNNKIEYNSMHGEWVVIVDEVATTLVEQKKDKTTRQDEVPLETFMYGGQKILIHVAWCFSLFLKLGFIHKVNGYCYCSLFC